MPRCVLQLHPRLEPPTSPPPWPGVSEERHPTAVVCDTVLVFVAARNLRPRVRPSYVLLLMQWRLVEIWVSRAHVSARKDVLRQGHWAVRLTPSPPPL